MHIPTLAGSNDGMCPGLAQLPDQVLKGWQDLGEEAASTDPKLQASYVSRLGWPCTEEAISLHADLISLSASPGCSPFVDPATPAKEHLLHLLVQQHLREINETVRHSHFPLREVRPHSLSKMAHKQTLIYTKHVHFVHRAHPSVQDAISSCCPDIIQTSLNDK